VISEVGAIVDPEHEDIVGKDADEGIWEEAEAEVRHQGQLTQNFLLLMALGGAVGATGFVLESTPQTISIVAASVIAPGFEVVARIPFGLVLRRWSPSAVGCARFSPATRLSWPALPSPSSSCSP
jgi:hypothetical protein